MTEFTVAINENGTIKKVVVPAASKKSAKSKVIKSENVKLFQIVSVVPIKSK